MHRIRLALIGAGQRGLHVYGRLLQARPEVEIVALAEPDPRRRQEAGRALGLTPERLCSDWRGLASSPVALDGAVIATPDPEHLDPALAFMDRGCHLLLEKPMAVTPQGCLELAERARALGRHLKVAHVLRYTPYFRELRRLVQGGALGQVVTVRHLEAVNFWHQAHSFVRGNWSRQDRACPMILAKSGHDFDILRFLLGRRLTRVASFGALSHFRADQAPPESTERCLDCPRSAHAVPPGGSDPEQEPCPYSAADFYLGHLRQGAQGWPIHVLTDDPSEEGVLQALRHGPYGRCVYRCDNDVVDHQVVAMEWEGGISGTFTMTAFTPHRSRETEILGSHAQLTGDGHSLRLTRFVDGSTREWVPDLGLAGGGHGGGDAGVIEAFLEAVRSGAPPDPVELQETVEAHLAAFAAERARLEGRVVEIDELLEGGAAGGEGPRQEAPSLRSNQRL